MATTTRRSRRTRHIRAAAALDATPRGLGTLTVSGTIPEDLDGSLRRAIRHPLDDRLLESGLRLHAGQATWYRAATGGQTGWRSARVRYAGPTIDEVGSASVARPSGDPVTNLRHTVATYPGLDHAEHLWLGQDGAIRHAEPFALPGAPLMHTVATTARYLVVLDLPVVHRPAVELLGTRLPYSWEDGRPARIGLIDRWGNEPRWFDIQPCYVFNAVNAYDSTGGKRDRVIIDVVRHERAYSGMPGAPSTAGTLWRFTLDLRDGSVEEKRLAKKPVESPEVDPRVRGREHRFVYGVTADGALLRHDVARGVTRVRELGAGRRAEQPVYVPRPGTSAEGGGWLLVVVHDFASSTSELLILNAEDPCGPAIATVHLPVALPGSVHTRWQPGG
jgi:8'-apo-carotenoid 13,14-cleaving dioxygenase